MIDELEERICVWYRGSTNPDGSKGKPLSCDQYCMGILPDCTYYLNKDMIKEQTGVKK